MANLKAKDADSVTKFLKAVGTGTDDDPLIVEHLDSFVLEQVTSITNKLTNDIASNQKLQEIIAKLESLLLELQTKTNVSDTQEVTGIVQISNLPSIQSVMGVMEVGNFPATQPVSGTVAVSNFPATQPVSGTVTVGNFPTTQSIVDHQISYVEAGMPLAANGTITGANRDAQNRNTVRGWVWTNVNGNLYIEQSINNSTWRVTNIVGITGSTSQVSDFVFRLLGRYYRLRYVNGNNAQSSFEMISTTFGIGL